ncbi:MAG: class I SAM-dependent methyltransferase [Candidatus Daviesbacteria bacterium]|nr:class I SAM-dependent methyltransferase [Candidatus Daviesbacteria bacterium]
MKNLWYSSYEKNNYGDFFYALMRIYQPEKVVELGTKAGYSAYHIARALKDNKKGKLYCHDLWENYQFSSVPKTVAEENLKEFSDFVQLIPGEAIGIDKNYERVDILHVDLSNEGEILDKIIPQWIDKVRQLIIIEGGSSERDKVEWMKKFKKMPIKKWLEGFARSSGNIEYFTIEPFPSVTIIRTK